MNFISNSYTINYKYSLFLLSIYFFFTSSIFAQLSVTTCPQVDKLNNGNGQSASSAGIFPGYGQNNPVATNVIGTSYQTVNFDPAAKTGNYILKWPSATALTNIPIITRVWITNSSGVTTLSNVVFGPPPPPYVSGGYYFVNYSYYVQNLPNGGKVTLEFADPQTGTPSFNCSFDLATGTTTTPPVYSCTPTVSTPPTSQILCDNGSVTFTASTLGATTYKWQYSSNSGSTWTDITQAGNFTSVSLTSLTVANRLTYTGYQFRIAVTNSCGTTNSTAATLTVNPMPTAVFSGSTSVCGVNQTRSIGVTLTGTAPWTINYTVNGVATSISNITASPYYFSVTPALTTTYILTSVTDANCYNSTLTGSTTLTVYPQPTVTPSNASACLGSSTFSLTYASTNSPNQYSIATSTRALSSFTAISNAALTATPLSVTIPTSGNAAGTYDFTISVRNSTSGCTASGTFTLTLNALPVVTASASSYSVCSGGASTLTAVGASTYTWSPATYLSGTSGSSVTANPTATTTYTATGTNAAGCIGTSSVTITATSTFSVSISASTATTCSGGQATLTASGGNTYSWSGPSSYSATGNPVVVTPSATGTYTLTGTDINGCTATATQTITVGGGPTVTVSSNVTICYGSSTTLTASGATTYAWTPSTSLSASTGTSVTATPTTTTTYTVYGTTSGCTNTASVTVTVTQSTVTSMPSQVVYCPADYSGSNELNVTITTSSNQTFTWERSADNATWLNSWTGNYRIIGSYTNVSTSTIAIKTPSAGNPYYRVSFTTNGCTFTYPSITLSKLTGTTTNSDVSSAQTICSGTVPNTLTSTGTTYPQSGTSYTYTWQSSTDNSTFTDIASSNSTSYSPGALSQSTYYRIKMSLSSGSSCSGTYYTSSVLITVATAITNNTVSLADACTGGTQITGSTPTGGTGSYTYQWQSSTTSSSSGFSDVVNATSQSYTPLIPSVTTWYKRLVSSGSCTNSESNVIAVYPPITSTQISNGQTVCSGTSLTALSTSPTGGPTGSSFTYLWYSSTDNSSFTTTGITTSTYSPSTSTGTNYYKVLITKGSCSIYSNTAKIVVNALPTVTISASSASVCSGSTSTLTASGATSYSWSPITDLDVSTGSTVVSTLTATRTYTVTGTNTTGCTSTATSTITYSASPSTPTLSGGSSTICSTASPFNLTTLITSGGTNEWFSVPNNSVTYKLASTSVSSSGTYYVYSKSGSCYSSSYASYALTINDVTAPVTSTSSVSVCSPSTVNLTSLEPTATSGTTLNWFTDNTHTTAVVSPTSVSSGTYYLFAYSTAGACYGPASSVVTITINSLPTVSVSSGTLSTCDPGTLDLTSTRSATAGITYRWYTTNTSPPSAANLIAQPTIMGNSGTYYVFAFNNTTNCISSSPASVVATINAIPTLVLTSPETKCNNSSTSVSVNVTNGVTSPTYQWLIYNQTTDAWDNLSNTGVYTGATTTTLTISSNNGLDGSAYKCLVSSSGCSDYSDIGVLGVSSPSAPSVTLTQPTCSTATGSAEVTSYNGSLTFSLDGGAYQSSTTFSGITQNSNHSIVAKVDVLGCLSSATNFTINAQPAQPTSANAGDDQINNGSCSTNSITLSANAPSTGTGAWSVISGIGGTFGSATSNTSTFTGSYNTSYTLRWATTMGACTSTDEKLVKICNSVVALPIELVAFSVIKSGENNLLKWTTASEKNNDYFTIEKTKDGIQFDVIGIQSGAGNSIETNNYSFTDSDVYNIINYYRLKQTDYDGKCIYSDLISMDNSIKNKEIKSIRNLLGQEVQINYHGIVIIFYQDGTSIKIIQ
jgi:hypothetical protein